MRAPLGSAPPARQSALRSASRPPGSSPPRPCASAPPPPPQPRAAPLRKTTAPQLPWPVRAVSWPRPQPMSLRGLLGAPRDASLPPQPPRRPAPPSTAPSGPSLRSSAAPRRRYDAMPRTMTPMRLARPRPRTFRRAPAPRPAHGDRGRRRPTPPRGATPRSHGAWPRLPRLLPPPPRPPAPTAPTRRRPTPRPRRRCARLRRASPRSRGAESRGRLSVPAPPHAARRATGRSRPKQRAGRRRCWIQASNGRCCPRLATGVAPPRVRRNGAATRRAPGERHRGRRKSPRGPCRSKRHHGSPRAPSRRGRSRHCTLSCSRRRYHGRRRPAAHVAERTPGGPVGATWTISAALPPRRAAPWAPDGKHRRGRGPAPMRPAMPSRSRCGAAAAARRSPKWCGPGPRLASGRPRGGA
mmetsp:Transcript_55153/g.159674  ORF Transcript_55153/g.159674 Transcript_55153/m.159674 type:complete len:412 (-) Transcript_55153:310-1545(-)